MWPWTNHERAPHSPRASSHWSIVRMPCQTHGPTPVWIVWHWSLIHRAIVNAFIQVHSLLEQLRQLVDMCVHDLVRVEPVVESTVRFTYHLTQLHRQPPLGVIPRRDQIEEAIGHCSQCVRNSALSLFQFSQFRSQLPLAEL